MNMPGRSVNENSADEWSVDNIIDTKQRAY